MRVSTHENRHLASIIRQAQLAGAEIPKIKFREAMSEIEAFDLEKALIAAIGREVHGGPLVNLTDGGDGESGRVISAEQRAKLRVARLGKKHTLEARAKISAAGLGQKPTAEQIEKNRAAQLGKPKKPWTEETRRKQRANNPGHTGHRHTNESKAKIREARARQAPLSEDAIKKIAESSRGRRHSDQTREKIRATWARRKAASQSTQLAMKEMPL